MIWWGKSTGEQESHGLHRRMIKWTKGMEECKQQRRKEELQKTEERNEKSHRLGQDGVSWEHVWRENEISKKQDVVIECSWRDDNVLGCSETVGRRWSQNNDTTVQQCTLNWIVTQGFHWSYSDFQKEDNSYRMQRPLHNQPHRTYVCWCCVAHPSLNSSSLLPLGHALYQSGLHFVFFWPI